MTENEGVYAQNADGTYSPAVPIGLLCEFPGCDSTEVKDYIRTAKEKDGSDWDTEPICLCKEHAKGHWPFPENKPIDLEPRFLGPHKRIVLVARAASGKDFLRNKLAEKGYKPSISITTRPPRANEVNGVDYIFKSEQEALIMTENEEFYEHVWFNGWLYGTTKEQFNTDDVFIMTPSGLALMKPSDRKNSFVIFLDIDSDTRRNRLSQREMPGDSIDRRLEADERDFKDFTDYDLRITNPDF